LIVHFKRTIAMSKSVKIRCLAFLLLLLTSSVVPAQNGILKSEENKNSYITLSLWPIADPYAPRFRAGYIQHVSAHWKVGLDLGLGTENTSLIPKTNNIGIDYQLWEVRPEFYYVFNPSAKTLKYLSAELFYIDQQHVFVDGDYSPEDSAVDFRFDRADFDRQKYGMHIKFGLLLNLGKHLGFNFYGGLGFRIADKQYSNFINREEADIFREWFSSPYTNEGSDFLPNPSLGIKFYYKL